MYVYIDIFLQLPALAMVKNNFIDILLINRSIFCEYFLINSLSMKMNRSIKLEVYKRNLIYKVIMLLIN